MKKILSFALIAATFVACSQSPKQAENEAPAGEEKELVFGEDFNAENVVLATSLNDLMEGQSRKEVTVKANVNAVCKKKGCWMDVDLGNGEEMKVTFKDYGFFVPLDIDSQTVVMHGVATYDTIPVDVLKHYAEDAGKSEDEIAMITDAELQLVFEATGVKLEE